MVDLDIQIASNNRFTNQYQPLRFTSDPANSYFSGDDSGNTASYAYDGLGERVFKYTPGTRSTLDYVYLNGQVMSEHTSDGNYRDFIYANGTKIASVAWFDIHFHLSGVNGSTNDSNRSTAGYLPLPQNPVIQPGDVLSYRMFQNNATTGISIGFTDGTNSDSNCSACRTPLTAANQWVSQNIPLSSAMNGKTISSFALGNYPGGPNGQFDVMIADVALNHADGSVTPFPFSIQNFSTGGDTTAVSNLRFFGEQVARDSGNIGAQALTRYFSADHLGTAQFELSSGGWPVWEGQFTPYGQELDNQQTYNNYKFTGKERDTESGLDYFGARYYASNMGRFMSPDWSAKAEPVPYAKLWNPQTLNLYAYVGNNPLSRIDADGHYELNASNCGDNAKCQKKYDKAANKFENRREKNLNSKNESIRNAAASYGAKGEVNGVHVGFGDTKSGGTNGGVDISGSGPGNTTIQVTLDFSRAGSSETITHEGTHVMEDQKFLNSFDPATGGFNQNFNLTHFQTEFDPFRAGAMVNHEHGFGPNDVQGITNYINTNYPARILPMMVFPVSQFPAGVPDDEH